jgi:hypothetical protein
MGDMRILYEEYFKHLGDIDRQNPFDGLTFSEKFKRSRPPFPIEWVRDKIFKPGTLAGMNAEARGIVLVLSETGARAGRFAICIKTSSSSGMRFRTSLSNRGLTPKIRARSRPCRRSGAYRSSALRSKS